MRKRMPNWLYLVLCLWISGCAIPLPDTNQCSVAATLSAGAVCATTLSHKTSDMTLDEFIAFLEPTDTRAGAICESSEDRAKEKTVLQQLCDELGHRCTKEVKAYIKGLR